MTKQQAMFYLKHYFQYDLIANCARYSVKTKEQTTEWSKMVAKIIDLAFNSVTMYYLSIDELFYGPITYEIFEKCNKKQIEKIDHLLTIYKNDELKAFSLVITENLTPINTLRELMDFYYKHTKELLLLWER